jgi:hypothetical protein
VRRLVQEGCEPGRGRNEQTPACHICSISSSASSCFSSCATVRRGR